MPDIHHLIRFGVPVDEVFAAISTEDGIRSWWTPDVRLDSEQGGSGEFRFYGGEKETRVRIDALDAPRQVAWTVVESFRPEWLGTTISFDLRPLDAGSELRFAQRGYPHADENFALCTTGWGVYLGRLQQELDRCLKDKAAAIVGAFAAEVGDRNTPVALVVDFRVREGAERATVERFAYAAAQTADEPGAIAYRLHHAPGDPRQFLVYERWRSLNDLEDHLRQPHIVALRDHIDEVIEGEPSFRVLLPS